MDKINWTTPKGSNVEMTLITTRTITHYADGDNVQVERACYDLVATVLGRTVTNPKMVTVDGAEVLQGDGVRIPTTAAARKMWTAWSTERRRRLREELAADRAYEARTAAIYRAMRG